MGEAKYQKSYFDVLGLCCPSEVPLVEKLLQPLQGVQRVSVIVPSRTVIVVHDVHKISPSQIAKALNQARLEASVRSYGAGAGKITNIWPSPYIIVCGTLLVVSLFEHFFHPLKWLALAAAAAGLPPIVLRSFAAARRFTLDINILMLIAVAGAIALRDYSEAGFIVFLFTTAEWLETRASHKATAGMSSLMSMAPQKAVLAETGQEVEVQDVKVNTVIAVKAGEVIPIDGVVVDGRSEVDERTLTGESFPVAKQAQSQVWAGTLNIDGYITVRTTAMAEDSAVAKMARLVEESQNSRSKTQRLIDSCAKYYTPAVVVMAATVAVIPLAARAHNLRHWFQLALVLLVSACPCALVLSTPIATFCALLRATRTGLLIKGGDVLESLARIKVAAFDKTGTITRGEFSVEEFQPVGDHAPMQKLLYWVSSIESKSSHPMASALIDYSQSNSVEAKPENVTEFQIYPGEGIYGEIDGKDVYIGNKRIVSRASCETVPDTKDLKGVTIGYVISNKELVGVFTLSDACRTGSAEAIKELRSLGISSVMLTGDSAAAATYAQSQLGNILEEVHSELLPEGKVRIIDELKAKHGPTLMIGDGMNDAPALAKADVGVSMGVSGSAVAMETSHITLMSNDIRKIPKAIHLARRTHRTIIVNILFSVMTKLAILALAFAGHPILWAAVLADVGTCLVVIMYSMLLLREKNTKKAKKCCSSSHHRSDAKKHVAANHCSDRSCKSTVHCKEPHNSHSSASQHGCHDHDHDHNHRQEPNNSRSAAIEHGCHDHDHDHNHEHNHCQQPNNSHSAASKHACHDHDHDHDHCKEPSSLHPSAAKHSCHDHDNDHDHCKEPSTSHTTEDHACHGHDHDHDHDHDHEYCKETQALHNPDEHACHDHVEVKQPHHHSHCCYEQVKDTSNASPEHSISITAPPDHHEQHSQCSHHDQEHREESCGDHLKAKNDAPPPTNCGGGSSSSSKCCSKNASKACSSLQIAGAGQCCRRYKKGGGRRSRCCSHGMVKLPEIVVE